MRFITVPALLNFNRDVLAHSNPGGNDRKYCNILLVKPYFRLDSCKLPSNTVLTPRGTRPPYQSRVLRPKETACAKLSWPLRIPVNRDNSEILSVLVDTK